MTAGLWHIRPGSEQTCKVHYQIIGRDLPDATEPPTSAFRIIGVHLPTVEEPCTHAERESALTWYADAIKAAEGFLCQARSEWRFEWTRRCWENLSRLQKERAVWYDAFGYALAKPAPHKTRPFNYFATSRGMLQ